MSEANEIIHTIYEFRNLLQYLGENYPNILDEWKSKAQGLTTSPAPMPTVDDDPTTIPGTNQNGRQDREYSS